MAGDLETSLKHLNTFDVALLLTKAIRVVDERVEAGDYAVADRLVESWRSILGPDLPRAASAVDEVRGHLGYQRAAAAFARDQKFRLRGMEWLAYAVLQALTRQQKRWTWLARGYVSDVLRFAETQALRQSTIDSAARAAELVPSRSLNGYIALRASYRARERYLSNSPRTPPDRSRHNHDRIIELKLAGEEFAEQRASLLAERDEWRALALEGNADARTLRFISSLSSVRQQVLELRHLVSAAKQAHAVSLAKGRADAVDRELAEIRAITAARP